MLTLSLLALNSCDDALDEMPDKRATVETKEDIQKILVSAYPENSFILIAEMSSDNTDEINGVNNPYSDRFLEEIYAWEASMQRDNEDARSLWNACYAAIASANTALAVIEEKGFPEDLKAERAEALLARAYSHFILVNMFCQHYTKEFSNTDLGIFFIEKPEATLKPHYERGTVADVYEKIDRDLQIALPLVSEEYYKVPKYHFNSQAAYAFAARFYLYYQDFDKAIECATKALGASPESLMKDNLALSDIPKDPLSNVALEFVNHASKSNFLLMTHYSNLGWTFGAYYANSRYNHSSIIANTESIRYPGPWISAGYYLEPWVYEGTNLNKILLPRLPALQEYTDPVAGNYYARTVHAVFTAEETLLVRAEAYTLKKNYENALADMNIWIKATCIAPYTLTIDEVNNWPGVNNGYYTPEKPTTMKPLNPEFDIEAGTQENMIHLLLFMRRYETVHTGLRWFDIKRYGIEVHRRLIQGGKISEVGLNPLKSRYLRSAIQIPYEAIEAGHEPNPRP